MLCKSCNQPFNKQERTPRIMVSCGHTVCQDCIITGIKAGSAKCNQCNIISNSLSLNDYPKNLILMGDSLQITPLLHAPLCNSHCKPLEAFCEQDHTLLCIDCILTNDHKLHEINPIALSCEKEIEKLRIIQNTLSKMGNDSIILINNLESYKADMHAKATHHKDQTTEAFNEIINALHERESIILQDIANTIEKEEKTVQIKLTEISAHKTHSNNFCNDIANIDHEDPITILKYSKERENLSALALKPLPTMCTKQITFPEVNKVRELNHLLKMVSAKQLSTTSGKSELQKPITESSKQLGDRHSISISKILTPVKYKPKKNQLDLSNMFQSSASKLTSTSFFTSPSSHINKFSLMWSNDKKHDKKRELSIESITTTPYNVKANKSVMQEEYNTEHKKSEKISQKSEALKKCVRSNEYYKSKNHEESRTIELNSCKVKNDDKTKQSAYRYGIAEKRNSKAKITHNFTSLNVSARQNIDSIPSDNKSNSPNILEANRQSNNSRLTDTNNILDDFNAIELLNSVDYSCLFPSITHFIYVLSGMQKVGLTSCERYDIQKTIWKETKPMIKPKSKFACSACNSKVYIIGGKLMNGVRTQEIECYDPKIDQWYIASFKLNKPLSSLSSVSDENGIYICGGSDGQVQSQLYHLNIKKDEWSALPDMINKREEFGFVIGEDKCLYAIGGYNGKQTLRVCEKYKIDAHEWVSVCPLKEPRRSFCVATLPDGIYAIGGHDGSGYLSSCEKYDYKLSKWISIKPLHHARCSLAGVSSPDCRYIYAMGGYDGSAVGMVERYDAQKGCWEFIEPMKLKRFMHSACLLAMSDSKDLV